MDEMSEVKIYYILFGQKQILEYIKLSDERTFSELIANGFPAKKICGRWTAHTANIDDWFRTNTVSTIKKNSRVNP